MQSYVGYSIPEFADLKFPLESSFMLLRPSNEPELLEVYFEPSLTDFAVGASPQAGRGREVKVSKGDIGDSESGSVRSFQPTSLGFTGVDGCVRHNQRVLNNHKNNSNSCNWSIFLT